MKPHSATSRELWFLDTRVVIRVSCDDGADEVSVLEHQAAYGDSPPLHVHHNEDEIFHVIQGELQFRLGDRDLRATAGDTVLAPKRGAAYVQSRLGGGCPLAHHHQGRTVRAFRFGVGPAGDP